MASSKQKGNIAPFLLFLSLVLFIAVLVVCAIYMFPDGIKSGKYTNPNVASKIVQGSVFDKNGKALSIEIPVYDNDGNVVEYKRNYPATFHACHVLNEVVIALSPYLNPRPGYNEAVTYGDDVYLTLDLDVQYVLDLATQMLYSENKCSSVVAYIADANTGEMLAISNYPFYNLNSNTAIGQNKALVSSINVNGLSVKTKIIDRIVDHGSNTIYSSKSNQTKDFGLSKDIDSTVSLLNDNSSIYEYLPNSVNPKYVVFIGATDLKTKVNKSEIINLVIDGLSAQSKI